MLQRLRDLEGEKVRGIDGDIGHISEFLFDMNTWHIRYAVVDVGPLVFHHKVLIFPDAFNGQSDDRFSVQLTREQIQNSPDINTDKPMSLAQEEGLFKYFGWAPYWQNDYDLSAPGAMPLGIYNNSVLESRGDDLKKNLKDTRQVRGYHVRAENAEAGEVDDLICETSDWTVPFVLIDVGNFFHGKKVLLPAKHITNISWTNHEVQCEVSADTVFNGKEYTNQEIIKESR